MLLLALLVVMVVVLVMVTVAVLVAVLVLVMREAVEASGVARHLPPGSTLSLFPSLSLHLFIHLARRPLSPDAVWESGPGSSLTSWV